MSKIVHKVESIRFGDLAVDAENIFAFPEPIPGFEHCSNFALLQIDAYRPFSWLQSLEDAQICLPLVDPWTYFPDYQPLLPERSFLDWEAAQEDEIAVFCVVSPQEAGLSANLAAPLVFHQRSQRGAQVIAEESPYSLAEMLAKPC